MQGMHNQAMIICLMISFAKKLTVAMSAKEQLLKRLPGRQWCEPDEIAKWWTNSSNTECYACPKCRRGYGSTHPCGTVLKSSGELSIPIECIRCQKSQTFSPKYSTGTCRSCTTCHRNRKIKKKCTRRSDTVCGECKDNYYEETDDFGITTCEKCSKCCQDGKDKREQQCVGQGLKENICSYWDAQRCDKQTDQARSIGTPATISPTNFSHSAPIQDFGRRMRRGICSDVSCDSSSTLLHNVQPTERPSAASGGLSTGSTESMETPQKAMVINNTNIINNGHGNAVLVGVLLGGIFVIGLLVFLVYKLRTSKKQQSSSSEADEETPESVALQPMLGSTPSEGESGTDTPENRHSTKITQWLDDSETYGSDGNHEQICDVVNNFDFPQFTAVCVNLGVPHLKVKTLYDDGKFSQVLRVLYSTKNQLTLQDIANACKKYGLLVELLKKEDERLQAKLMVNTAEGESTVNQCSASVSADATQTNP